MKKSLVSMIFVLLLVGCATQQERAEQREAMRKAVAEAVAMKKMHIDITTMNTLRYGSKVVTSVFFLELLGDTLRSYLPYLGQAYQAPIGTPAQGLNFDAPILGLRESHPKTHLSQLEIDVKSKEDTYLYVVELYDTGKADIHVRSLHRDPISFSGDFIPNYKYE